MKDQARGSTKAMLGGSMEVGMNDRYDVTVRRNESEPEAVSIGDAYSVTLDEFGTLTIEAAGTIRSFPRGAWGGFSVTRVQRESANDLKQRSAQPT